MLRRRAPIVVVCAAIAAISAFAFARHETKQYTATSSVLFSQNPVGLLASGLGGATNPPSQSQQDTQVQLVGLGDVAAKTAKQLGPAWTAGRVKGAISISPNSDTSIVDVAATAATPAAAQRVANTYVQVFVAEQQQQTAAALATAQRVVTKQLGALTSQQRATTQGALLAQRAQQLELLSTLYSGNASIASLAPRPASPSSPNVKRDVELGALLGLLIGIAIAFTLERFDRRIRDPKDFEAIYQVPLLAAVPESREYQVLRSIGRPHKSGHLSPYDEVFNLMRSYLRYFAVDRDLRTMMVISADPGEGKTTVSYNLAKAAASLGSRVLVIEGDMRHSSVTAPLLDRPGPALPDVLVGDAAMDEAVSSLWVAQNGSLDVLPAGPIPPPNAGELIESGPMESVLEQASADYDLVVVDTPPLSLLADAIPLLRRVDGVIIVGRIGKSSWDAAEQLRDRLEVLRAPVLGVVANRVRPGQASGYPRRYRYYGYVDRETTDVAANGSGSHNGAPPPAGVRPRYRVVVPSSVKPEESGQRSEQRPEDTP